MTSASAAGPRSPITRRFRRYKLQLAATIAVADALRRAVPSAAPATGQRLKTLSRRMAACAASTTIKLITPPGEPTFIRYRNKRGCRSVLCASCARVRARKTVIRIRKRVDAVQAERPTTRFAFLTLTSRNLPIEDVAAMLRLHEQALDRFWRTDRIKQAFWGHATGIEIAIRRADGRWQAGVHSHSLLALAPTYFEKSATIYLSQRAIVSIWQRALRADYKPVAYVTAIADTDAARASLIEVLKYAVAPHRLFERDGERLNVDPLVASCLANALYKRRLCRTGGVFATRPRRSSPP